MAIRKRLRKYFQNYGGKTGRVSSEDDVKFIKTSDAAWIFLDMCPRQRILTVHCMCATSTARLIEVH